MELWIRSQDKEDLVKLVGRLHVQETSVNPHSFIFAVWVDSSQFGFYNSEERALEIVDEIQNILAPKYVINSKSLKSSAPYFKDNNVLIDCSSDARIEQLNTCVYEMPKE